MVGISKAIYNYNIPLRFIWRAGVRYMYDWELTQYMAFYQKQTLSNDKNTVGNPISINRNSSNSSPSITYKYLTLTIICTIWIPKFTFALQKTKSLNWVYSFTNNYRLWINTFNLPLPKCDGPYRCPDIELICYPIREYLFL